MASRGEREGSTIINRAFGVLEAVVQAERPMTVAELALELGLPKPTVHRLTQQLAADGFLERDLAGRKRLVPGGRLTMFSMDVISSAPVRAPRHAVLQRLSSALGETCNITVLDGNQILYLDRVEADWPIRIQLKPGTHLPLHCTASGKLFLGYMTGRQRRTVIDALQLEPHTPRTLTDPEELDRAVRQARKDNLGVDDEEFIEGMVALAVPVMLDAKRIVATVAVHAPTSRRSLRDLYEAEPVLRDAADRLAVHYSEETCDS